MATGVECLFFFTLGNESNSKEIQFSHEHVFDFMSFLFFFADFQTNSASYGKNICVFIWGGKKPLVWRHK